uniref:Uncharacterized protein n=1 Tax=Arundo donax TaxID=35708 RepID=A0A0A9AKP7_ARUDO
MRVAEVDRWIGERRDLTAYSLENSKVSILESHLVKIWAESGSNTRAPAFLSTVCESLVMYQ